MNWFWMNIPLAAVAFRGLGRDPAVDGCQAPALGPGAGISAGNPELAAMLVSVQGGAAGPVGL